MDIHELYGKVIHLSSYIERNVGAVSEISPVKDASLDVYASLVKLKKALEDEIILKAELYAILNSPQNKKQ